MKRVLFALLLVFALALKVPAAENPRIIDRADLLTAQEEAALEEQARVIREEWDLDVVILTVDSLDGKSPRAYADDYYDRNGFGCGPEQSGMLFLLTMEDRDWYISTHGRATDALPYDAIGDSVEDILPSLSQGDYGEGFSDWLRDLPRHLHYQAPMGMQPRRFSLGIPVLIGLVSAAGAVLAMVLMNKTGSRQTGAAGYLDAGTFRMFNQKDLFLHSHVSKTRKAEPSSGSRSGTHRSSSGRSHGGRGGKF